MRHGTRYGKDSPACQRWAGDSQSNWQGSTRVAWQGDCATVEIIDRWRISQQQCIARGKDFIRRFQFFKQRGYDRYLRHNERVERRQQTVHPRRRCTTGASDAAGAAFLRTIEPAIVVSPATSSKSLIETGKPASGDSVTFAVRIASACAAAALNQLAARNVGQIFDCCGDRLVHRIRALLIK